MAYRYCPKHEKWLSTSKYTVDGVGETVCPEHDIPLVGFIPSGETVRATHCDFRSEKQRKKAVTQGLIDG